MTQVIKSILKTAGYGCAFAVAHLTQQVRATRSSAIILMYHSFDETGWKYGVPPKELEKQLAYLASHSTLVSFAEVVAFARDGVTPSPHPSPHGRGSRSPLPMGEGAIPLSFRERVGVRGFLTNSHTPIAITIDDVYEDTYTVLFPLLKKYHAPATLFLTTDLAPRDKLGKLPRPTWAQLKEMQDSGLVTVEVHGRTHVNWPTLETDEALAGEILGARDDIESHLGYRSRFAAYPAGRRDARIAKYLDAHGFEAAVATTEGVVRMGDAPFALKRVQVDRSMNFTLFRVRLDAGTLHFIHALKRWGIR